ncbi:hypothetical protein E6P09_09550 [Haloferax mediterranei ATCC 33500]|uniref:Uncharacterized protein n=1 Tax=Haloferax mediterranei (strain ATCC 33500 / DSM 1411 / JCM 8866 / NBRC 14739 / NCIMB 2177 / R-4) TaxID=523841 RepID=I3R460_HALMT|nr:hypothetical protein [Haloferax mediterranei]AFK19020.1 hypothetical protein HFX_1308 [Haloferax mediterranei ATCC 33500]AHZ21621.1 hypothetical protein BM92_02645 [Haloferax mediterranei ATCC 33500]EMA03538.1 hypothetical protein C439_03965 [Haloferax mediterranei ATCC 33500]MDX5989113.1 hypothetical protein [Haloferax mediterranei ATCC 33500]QCQ75496.1 hypothetical protein E6P09_09550 [Haloferax mediterranei ATCC 33500]
MSGRFSDRVFTLSMILMLLVMDVVQFNLLHDLGAIDQTGVEAIRTALWPSSGLLIVWGLNSVLSIVTELFERTYGRRPEYWLIFAVTTLGVASTVFISLPPLYNSFEAFRLGITLGLIAGIPVATATPQWDTWTTTLARRLSDDTEDTKEVI